MFSQTAPKKMENIDDQGGRGGLFWKDMKLLTILYEGPMLWSLLDPTGTIITGDTELKPATVVDSSRFWSEGHMASLHDTEYIMV